MKTLHTICLGLLALFLSGCDQPGSSSGVVGGASYSAFWKDKPRTTENLALLVISDFADETSPAKGQGLFGSGWEPILSGYHDRDGEVVTFAMVRPNTLLILDKYLDLRDPPIVHVFRDSTGLLDVRNLSPDSELASEVLAEINKE